MVIVYYVFKIANIRTTCKKLFNRTNYQFSTLKSRNLKIQTLNKLLHGIRRIKINNFFLLNKKINKLLFEL